MELKSPPQQYAQKLLTWYGQHGRDLPWRNTREPYRIWLSEIMLQQTTVSAVIPYYDKFLMKFPTVRNLAAAELESVLELWAGLGYYSRARNLHKTAQIIVDELDGIFPPDVEDLMKLPGIGRSTAGAIVSIAFDQPAPILDGNVRRVLIRLMALQEPPRERQAEKKLWAWAEIMTSTDQPHDYAQAIMDLGATICLPRQPLCGDCPLAELCQARAAGMENALPVVQPRGEVPIRRQVVLVLRRGEQLLLQRRAPQGLLGGMWEFPNQEIPEDEQAESVVRELQHRFCPEEKVEYLGMIRHVYSHFRLEADIFLVVRAATAIIAADGDGTFWQTVEQAVAGPIHGAHQKALKLVMKAKV